MTQFKKLRRLEALRKSTRAISPPLLPSPVGKSNALSPRRYFLATFAIALALALPSPASAQEQPKRPNILVIMADDLGYADVGFHGGKEVPTPHLDALAASGVRCTSGYVSSPYCSPSRAGMLTGRYQTHFGHEFN